jgi:hypothetical protein|tara:strand:+ start:580 stop:1059 length:480 start_codon:yes stop_codon:yes gene_type:complete
METIKEAKQFLKENYKVGASCPCCSQHVKAYKRKIDAGVAVFLIKMSLMTKPDEFIHAEKVLKALGKSTKSMNYSIARYWDLIEREPIDKSNKTKKSSGNWKLTILGRSFVNNEYNPIKHVITYNSKRINWHEKTFLEVASIEECLGESFNYSELMKGF